MPVPVSVTNPQGQGLTAHTLQTIESEGPFERIKRLAAERLAQDSAAHTTGAGQQAQNGHSQKDSSLDRQGQITASSSGSVVVENLTFAYPGLGK